VQLPGPVWGQLPVPAVLPRICSPIHVTYSHFTLCQRICT
jgi:hypothetical protein